MRLRSIARQAVMKLGVDVRRVQHLSFTQTVMIRNEHDDAALGHILLGALRHDSSCVDIGAHTGGITGELVRLAPDGKHVAAEPIPELAEALAERFPTVDVHACAVGAERGRVQFAYVPDAPFLSGIDTTANASYARTMLDVELRTVDELLGGREIAVLKIDVEGAELGVLRGALGTLRSCRPVVVFEHTRVRFDAGMVAGLGPLDLDLNHGVYDVLAAELGYRIFDLDGVGPLSRSRFEDLYRSAERFNFVALP